MDTTDKDLVSNPLYVFIQSAGITDPHTGGATETNRDALWRAAEVFAAHWIDVLKKGGGFTDILQAYIVTAAKYQASFKVRACRMSPAESVAHRDVTRLHAAAVALGAADFSAELMAIAGAAQTEP